MVAHNFLICLNTDFYLVSLQPSCRFHGFVPEDAVADILVLAADC